MSTGTDERVTPAVARSERSRLLGRISRLEWGAAAVAAMVLVGLVIAEPDVVEAPFENARTVAFTFGGTALAMVALAAMLRLRVHPVVRVLVLGVPFVAVTWWLVSPFFVDDVVDDDFVTSIADAATPSTEGSSAPDRSSTTDASTTAASTPTTASPPTTAAPPAGPVLRGAGQFVGLAGHEGSGDAGFFALEDGSQVLRLENFDIENGPDLRLYVVPGAGAVDPSDDSLYLGELRGNVGDQTYDLPPDFDLSPGDWTVLVWCEAFRVEFVAATVAVG